MASRYTLDDFAFDLRQGVVQQAWVTSGWSTVALAPGTVCGVAGCFAPPYAAPDSSLRIELEVAGHRIPDGARPGVNGRGLLYAGGTWRPHQVVRRGTYHQFHDGALRSLDVRSTLTPLYGRAGYAVQVAIRNRAAEAVTITLHPELHPGGPRRIPLGEWGWVPPEPGPAPTQLGHGRWQAGEVTIDLLHEEVGVGPDGRSPTGADSTLLTQVVPAGAEVTFTLAVQIGAAHTTAPRPLSTWVDEAVDRCERRAAAVLARVPWLGTDVPGLDAYWRRSLASGLVCLWDNPSFVTNPFVATSGIDGGALCAYAWDTGGYAPHLLTLMLGDTAVDVLNALMAADLGNNYAIAPDGTGLGVAYAYSGWSLVTFAAAVAAQGGIDAGQVERLYATMAAIDAHFTPAGELYDYGTQHNLLEMRTAGWEHVVASPNTERAWSLDTLASLAEVSGADLPTAAMRQRAERIRKAVADDLWDPDKRWFRCRYPDGHTEIVHSVQAFDALRNGACSPSMAADLLSHLRPGAFLGSYGVSSVSAEDERHYELGDVDWSGGGAYTGEAPQLALTLWERGESERAWQVLSRLFWMGEHLPYFPQEHYSDRPGTPPVGRRANIIAGLTGAEAILTGLAGVRPQPDGRLLIDPSPFAAGNVTLRGLEFRGHTVDISVSPSGHAITVDGRPITGESGDSGERGGPVVAVPTHPSA
ncbi:MGH1-like glycoside hydrolase domain-containing protein [Actinopolymorpha alba]|uniref:MGH1-like glycoside hydrolase domain-containing protein n=1 Tax=Actinopolymorpha alba TaxID=533267 RepID=UPI00036E3C76|nr:hypothetical protein [Actinopolymorpha alba]